MTGFLFPVDVVAMSQEEITQPDYEHDPQALKRLGIDEHSQTTLDVQRAFHYCQQNRLYCVLCIWRDNQWAFCYKVNIGWPENGKPFRGQRQRAYFESKNGNHFFCLDGDYPSTYPYFLLKKAA